MRIHIHNKHIERNLCGRFQCLKSTVILVKVKLTGNIILKYGGWEGYAVGSPIAQAVSCWLPTAAARVQTRVWSCGIL
jgi:hypothetical protein